MPQICFGLSGGFGPVKRDLFQGTLFGGTCSESCVMADLLADPPSHDGTGQFREVRLLATLHVRLDAAAQRSRRMPNLRPYENSFTAGRALTSKPWPESGHR